MSHDPRDRPERDSDIFELPLTERQRLSLSLCSSMPVSISRMLRDAAPGPVRLRLSEYELRNLARRLEWMTAESKFPHTRRLEAIQVRLRRILRVRDAETALREERDSLRRARDQTANGGWLGRGQGPAPDRVPGRLYQFRVELEGVDPPIWRRLQVEDCTLRMFQSMLNRAMGWTWDIRMHWFEIDGETYGPPKFSFGNDRDDRWRNERAVYLHQLFPGPIVSCAIVPDWFRPRQFGYVYDHLALWRHAVTLEAMPEWIFDCEYPICLDGARACPNESVMRDLADYRAVLRGEPSPRGDSAGRQPVVPRSDEPPFDPEAFDREEATDRLRWHWNRNAEIQWRND